MAIINKLPPDSFSFPIIKSAKAPTEWKLITPHATLNPFANTYRKDIVFNDGEFVVGADYGDYRYLTNPSDLSSAWHYLYTGENLVIDDNWSGNIYPCMPHKNKFFSFMPDGSNYCTDADGNYVDYGYLTKGTSTWNPSGSLGLGSSASCACVWKDKLYVFDTQYCYANITEYGGYQTIYAGGYAVATSDDIMVVSTGSGIRYSTNGTSFTNKTFSSMGISGVSNLRGLTYGNGVFVGICKGKNIAVVSNDGINWQKITLPFTDNSNGRMDNIPIAFGNGYFVYISKNNNCAYSKDGVNWTTFTIDNVSSFNATDIAYGDGKFIAVTSTKNIALECEF